MKCPYCAEDIRDEAILCRFCGARREGDEWNGPAAPGAKPRAAGEFTIRSSAVLFFLAAAFELIQPTAMVPLWGDLRAGPMAIAYHALFAGLFGGLGYALWSRSQGTYRLTLATTAVYVADKLSLILDHKARDLYLVHSGAGMLDQLGGDVRGMINTAVVLTAWLSIAGFLGFALYIRYRKRYFDSDQARASRGSALTPER